MVVFDLFIRPLIWRLSGYGGPTWPLGRKFSATLTRYVSSPPGREDYVPVRLEEREGQILAHPVPGKSGAISTMVHADGMIRIDIDSEGLDGGAPVEVLLF
jgi:molybdopterin molybdotransferase